MSLFGKKTLSCLAGYGGTQAGRGGGWGGRRGTGGQVCENLNVRPMENADFQKFVLYIFIEI